MKGGGGVVSWCMSLCGSGDILHQKTRRLHFQGVGVGGLQLNPPPGSASVISLLNHVAHPAGNTLSVTSS